VHTNSSSSIENDLARMPRSTDKLSSGQTTVTAAPLAGNVVSPATMLMKGYSSHYWPDVNRAAAAISLQAHPGRQAGARSTAAWHGG
jgi:hypothetical protein